MSDISRGIRRILAAIVYLLVAISAAAPAAAKGPFQFEAIEGGTIDLSDFAGRPVLVVNTASRCAFTPQYDGLQTLYDSYRDKGLVVLAVPSDDFGQELASEAQVADFCALNFDLDLPMTTITKVKGRGVHPFYAWLAAEEGFVPRWNFNKVLLAPDGSVAATYGSRVAPENVRLTAMIEQLLMRTDAGGS